MKTRKKKARKEEGNRRKGGQSKGKQRKRRKERVKEREVRGKSRQDAQRKELQALSTEDTVSNTIEVGSFEARSDIDCAMPDDKQLPFRIHGFVVVYFLH